MPSLDYSDYKAFLKSRLAHGAQKRLAAHLRCQPAFLSQVLRGKPHLSLEQGILATEYFQMAGNEQEYFMLALQAGRAGSTKLENYYGVKMQKLRDQSCRVDAKIGRFDRIDELSRSTFYSSWKFAAVHVLLSIPSQNQVGLLKNKTGLSEREIFRVLDFLAAAGLIQKKSGRWLPSRKRIHLQPEDSLIGTHHKNFRALTLCRLDEPTPESLHFSAFVALSNEDAGKIRTLLLDVIARAETILKPSPEETARVFNVDFFEPGHSNC